VASIGHGEVEEERGGGGAGQAWAAQGRDGSGGHKTPKEEMRELIGAGKPKALRERLLKVWAKW